MFGIMSRCGIRHGTTLPKDVHMFIRCSIIVNVIGFPAASLVSDMPPYGLTMQAMVFTDQIFLGHIGTQEMAAAALGNMWAAFLQVCVHPS